MAVNKNFVVKNGLEVNADLIIANSDTKRVGIGSTVPQYNLDVAGGIGVTNIYVSGFSTAVGFSTFQDSIGVQNDITIAGISTVVGVATFRSDVYIDGNLNVVGDIVYDEVNGRNIYISGLSTFVGMSTFKSDIFVAGVSTFSGDIDIHGSAGVTSVRWDQSQQSIEFLDETKATFGTNNDLQISHTNSLKDQDDSEGNSIVDGWTSYIHENGTGGLVFKSNGNSGEGAYQFFDTSWRPILRLFSGASARAVFYYGGIESFETTGVGATVHGSLGILTDLTVGAASSFRDIVVSGASTFNGPTTFNYGAITFANVNATNQNVTGIGTVGILSATDAVVSGAATFNNDITVLGDLNVTGDLSYDEVTGRNLNITGIATIGTLVGYSSEFSGAIGFSSQTSATDSSTLVGAAITTINFIGGGATAYTSADSRTLNVTLPPAGASIGLAIALGG